MAESAVPDVLAPGLRVVFCGINPGFRSAAAAAHFANPRNDFWRLLADADLTPRLLVPEEQWEMLDLGFGLTNTAYRTTKGSGDLRRGDFAGSAERFERRPRSSGPRSSRSSARRRTKGCSGSGPSTACRSAVWARRASSSCRRPRPRTLRFRTRRGCAGSERCAPSSGARNVRVKGISWAGPVMPQRGSR